MTQRNNTVHMTSVIARGIPWVFHHRQLIMSNAALQ